MLKKLISIAIIAPFGSTSERTTAFIPNDLPGPGTYDLGVCLHFFLIYVLFIVIIIFKVFKLNTFSTSRNSTIMIIISDINYKIIG